MAENFPGLPEKYDPQSNNWVRWKAKFEQFIAKQSIPAGEAGEIKKRAFLIVSLEGSAFRQLRDKLAPNRPSTKTKEELMMALDELFVGESLETAGEDGQQRIFSPQNKSATPSQNIIGQKVKSSSSSPGTCSRCGKSGHVQKECHLPEDESSFNCGGEGRIVNACRERRASQEPKETSDNEDNIEEDPGECNVLTVHGIDVVGPPAIVQELCTNGKIVQFELNTGAMLSLVGRSTWKELGSPHLSQSSSKLRGVSGGQMKVLGECQVQVNRNSQTQLLPLLVVDEVEINVCGRNWLNILKLISVDQPQVSQLNNSPISANSENTSDRGSPVEATIVVMDNHQDNSSVPTLPRQTNFENASNPVLVRKEEEVCVVPGQLVHLDNHPQSTHLSPESKVEREEKLWAQSEHLAPLSELKVQQNLQVKQKKLRVKRRKKDQKSCVQSSVWKNSNTQFKVKVQFGGRVRLKSLRRKPPWSRGKVRNAQGRVCWVFTKFKKKVKQQVHQLHHRRQPDKMEKWKIDKGRQGRESMPMKKGRPKVKLKSNQEPVQETVDLEEPRSSGG